MLSSAIQTWSTVCDQVTRMLSALAGILLVLMTLLISLAVLMRYVAGAPILGVNELVQLNAVALVMLALPYATHTSAHVRADLFDPTLGRFGRFMGDILTRLISMTVLAFLVRRAIDKALDAREFGDATNMLELPIWPFYALIALGAALCILVFAVELVTIIATRRAMGDSIHE